MGCIQSKGSTDDLAADFFGNDDSVKDSVKDTRPPVAAQKLPSETSESLVATESRKNTSPNALPVEQQRPKPQAKTRKGPAVRPREMNEKPRKSESGFKAPPSSESFIGGPPNTKKLVSSEHEQTKTSQKALYEAKTPKPDNRAKTSSVPGEPRHLDDDDFSVAPSLGVAMRSIVKVSFEDIYIRGKKVSSR